MGITDHKSKTLELKREQLERAAPAIEEPGSACSQVHAFVKNFSQFHLEKAVFRSPELYERPFSIQMSRQDLLRLQTELIPMRIKGMAISFLTL